MSEYLWADDPPAHEPSQPVRAMSSFSATEPSVPIVVVEADPAVRSRLVMQLGERAVPVDTIDVVESRYVGTPLMLVLGPSNSLVPGVTGAEGLLARRPDIGAILIADNLSTEVFQAAMRSGVRDVLGAPVDTGQLNEAIRRVGATMAGPSGARACSSTPRSSNCSA